MPSDASLPSARAFVRSFNVLLKFARLYGLEHARAARQCDTAWQELHEAVEAAGPAGVILGTAASQLLINGEPLESTAAERSLADLLDAANVASICFLPEVTRDGFASLVRLVAESRVRSGSLAERLQESFGSGDTAGIRVNEIRFVPEGALDPEAHLATQLAARALDADAGRLQDWFSSPEKLIQLITAAEGVHGGGSNASTVPDAQTTGAAKIPSVKEADLQTLLRTIVQLGEATFGTAAKPLDATAWRQQLAVLPGTAKEMLRQVLAGIVAQAPSAKVDEATLLRVAESLAIRFALERFERGEVKVNAVQQMLDRLNTELNALRKLLRAREEKLAGAGVPVESRADVLDRQFWAAVPESGKRTVLRSPEAWCIPPRNVQQYVEQLLRRKEAQSASEILANYAACVRSPDTDGRKKAAIGLAQLAGLFGEAAVDRMRDVLSLIGRQMAAETEAEVQTLLGAAFVRLSQEAAARRLYPAMQQSLDSLADIEEARPSWAQPLRSRIGFENFLPDFIEGALASDAAPEGLAGVLVRLPEAAGGHLATRLTRAARRSEREKIVELAKLAGGPFVRWLEDVWKTAPPAKSASVVGLLSRLDPSAVDESLPMRLRQGGRAFHDAVVRQLAIGGAPERGRLLANSIEHFDVLALPLVIDEIGMCGDANCAPKLLRLAEGEILPEGSGYAQVKAIDALGRLRSQAAVGHLRRFVEERKAFGWTYPEEIRTAAAQALLKLDPDWMGAFFRESGLSASSVDLAPLDPDPERDVVRHRRYRRVRLTHSVPALISSSRGKYTSAISVLSLDGGLLSGDLQLAAGTQATLRISAGFRSINMDAVVRSVRPRQASFEAVSMKLEDRAKLRRLLVLLGGSESVPAGTATVDS